MSSDILSDLEVFPHQSMTLKCKLSLCYIVYGILCHFMFGIIQGYNFRLLYISYLPTKTK